MPDHLQIEYMGKKDTWSLLRVGWGEWHLSLIEGVSCHVTADLRGAQVAGS